MTIFVLTVGEKIVFETLKGIGENIPQPYKLIIWYNGSNKRFYKKLLKYTDDVIMSSVNNGMVLPTGSMMLYGDYDILMILNADNILNSNYYEDVTRVLEDESVGWVGQSQHELKKDYIYCNNNENDYFPDNFHVFRREFINDMGSLTPSHPVYGHIGIELYKRTITEDKWKVVCFNNDHLGIHGGRDRNISSGTDLLWEDLGSDRVRTELYYEDYLMWMRCQEKGYSGYNWFSNKL